MASDASNRGHMRDRLIPLAIVGLIAGLTASVFGVGGGIVMVPLLIALLRYDAKAAAATSLAAIIFTAVVGTASHGVLDNVDWVRGALIGLPAILGVGIGVRIKDRISSGVLIYAFAALMLAVAIRLALGGTDRELDFAVGAEVATVAVLGVLAGVVAGVFGVGGGIVFVPTLAVVLGMNQLDAEATSLLAIVPVALFGSWQNHARGLVAWPDALTIGAISAITAVAGALIAEVAPERALQVGFAVLLVATAAQLIQRARGSG